MAENTSTVEMKDLRVVAIRQHPRVGRGSCTVIDECYSDGELIEALDAQCIETVELAVLWSMHREETVLYDSAEKRWGEDNDSQLLRLESWLAANERDDEMLVHTVAAADKAERYRTKADKADTRVVRLNARELQWRDRMIVAANKHVECAACSAWEDGIAINWCWGTDTDSVDYAACFIAGMREVLPLVTESE